MAENVNGNNVANTTVDLKWKGNKLPGNGKNLK